MLNTIGMFLRIVRFLLIPSLCVALAGCATHSSVPAAAPPRGVTITYDEAVRLYRVVFDLTAVSHREAGRQYAGEIARVLPDFEKHTDAFLKKTLEESNMTFAQALSYANIIKENLPAEYLDEIEGMGQVFNHPSDEVGNGRLSPNKIFVSVIFEDTTYSAACAAAAVFGKASATGRTIVGRNNDWSPDEAMDHWNALFIFHNGDRSVVGNGTIGELFPNSVYNRHHVFIASLDSYPGRAWLPMEKGKGIRSPTADVRYAAENSRTLAEAERFISKSSYAIGSLILTADQDTAHVLEYDTSRPEEERGQIRTDSSRTADGVSWGIPGAVASVNSFLLPGGFANHVGAPHNSLRIDNFRKLFGGVLSKAPAGVKQMQGILGYTSWDGDASTSGAIFRLGQDSTTFQSIIVKMDTFETWLAYSAHGAPWPYTPVYYKVLDGSPFR